MKGLPRQPRRVAQTHAVAEKQKYLAVPYGEIKAASAAGLPAGAFKNASVTRFSRTVVSLDYGETFRLERSDRWSPCCQQKTRSFGDLFIFLRSTRQTAPIDTALS